MARLRKMEDTACLVCGTAFRAKRDWQRFCSDRCRSIAWRSKEFRLAEQACAYCGSVADTRDHIPPIVARKKLEELGIANRYVFTEVWCCRECNSLLNCRALWTVEQRKKWIKQQLRRRYAKYLKIPDWGDSELMALRPLLQQHTIHGLAVREWTKARIAY